MKKNERERNEGREGGRNRRTEEKGTKGGREEGGTNGGKKEEEACISQLSVTVRNTFRGSVHDQLAPLHWAVAREHIVIGTAW